MIETTIWFGRYLAARTKEGSMTMTSPMLDYFDAQLWKRFKPSGVVHIEIKIPTRDLRFVPFLMDARLKVTCGNETIIYHRATLVSVSCPPHGTAELCFTARKTEIFMKDKDRKRRGLVIPASAYKVPH
jgi:hypothetical protein